MKITLNLASRPYVDLRSVLRRLRLLMLVLIIIAIPLFLLLKSERKKAQSATDHVNAMQNHIDTLERQQNSYQALMGQPQNAAALNKAAYLNNLFRRKAFSWTATMTDLEQVLPAGVQVLSLDPAVMKNGDVVIHLRISGARDRAIELVQNLEKSRHFASPRLAGETLAQNSGPSNNSFQPISASSPVNFEILADYRPLSAEEEAASKKTESQKAPSSAAALHASPAKKHHHAARALAKPAPGVAKHEEVR